MNLQWIKKIKLSYRDQVILIIIVSLVLLVLALIPEDAIFQSNVSVCLHYKFFGIQCPFCGLTRAITALAHFRFERAIEYNFVIIPLFLLYIIEISWLIWKTERLKHIRKILLRLALIMFMIIYVFRIFIKYS